MTRLTYTSLSNLNGASAVASINANFAAVQTELEKALYRDGTATNSMTADLDMNSNNILNLPAAATSTEPVRKAEFDALDAEFDALETSVNAAIAAMDSATTDLETQLATATTVTNQAQALVDASENIVRVASWFAGKPGADEVLFRWEVTDNLQLEATESVGSALTAANAETVLSYKVEGTTVITATFAASGTEATWALVSGDGSVTAGDILTIVGPSSEDDTLAGVSLTLVGSIVA